MNQRHQSGLLANRRPSFFRRNLGKGVCYALVLIAVSWISWVQEGGCQACKKEFGPHTEYTKCRNALIKPGCDSRCANKLACEECKCYAVSKTGLLVQGYTGSCDTKVAGAALLAAFKKKECCEK